MAVMPSRPRSSSRSANVGADYYLAFTTGLLGGFGHCIGMCGPIVASLAWKQAEEPGSGGPPIMLQLQYHAGRIATYTLAGASMGWAGSFVSVAGRMAGIQSFVMLLAGATMVLMGASIAGMGRGTALLEGRSGWILSAARRVLAAPAAFRYPALGLLLGLLPCGLSYSIFIGAAGTGSLTSGALLSLFFGLGTLPAVLLFGSLLTTVSAIVRRWIYRAGGIAIIAMGVLFILRGVSYHAGL